MIRRSSNNTDNSNQSNVENDGESCGNIPPQPIEAVVIAKKRGRKRKTLPDQVNQPSIANESVEKVPTPKRRTLSAARKIAAAQAEAKQPTRGRKPRVTKKRAAKVPSKPNDNSQPKLSPPKLSQPKLSPPTLSQLKISEPMLSQPMFSQPMLSKPIENVHEVFTSTASIRHVLNHRELLNFKKYLRSFQHTYNRLVNYNFTEQLPGVYNPYPCMVRTLNFLKSIQSQINSLRLCQSNDFKIPCLHHVDLRRDVNVQTDGLLTTSDAYAQTDPVNSYSIHTQTMSVQTSHAAVQTRETKCTHDIGIQSDVAETFADNGVRETTSSNESVSYGLLSASSTIQEQDTPVDETFENDEDTQFVCPMIPDVYDATTVDDEQQDITLEDDQLEDLPSDYAAVMASGNEIQAVEESSFVLSWPNANETTNADNYDSNNKLKVLNDIRLCVTSTNNRCPRDEIDRLEFTSETSSCDINESTIKLTNNVQSSYVRRRKRRPIVTTSHLGHRFRMIISELERMKLIVYKEKMETCVTHVIMETLGDDYSKDNEGRLEITDYTMKYLLGLSRGLWLVSSEWLVKSFRFSALMDEAPYEVLDIGGLDVPKHSRMLSERVLLKNFVVYVMRPLKLAEYDQVVEVVNTLAGEVVESFDELLKENRQEKILVVIAEKRVQTDLFDDLLTKHNIVSVAVRWLIDSVGSYQLKPFKHHALCTFESYLPNYPDYLLTDVPKQFIGQTNFNFL